MRILIIDDDRDLAETLREILIAEFYAVDIATDGNNGSFMARTNDYDLVIVDYVLPGQTGAEVIAEIRQENKDLPIIMMTVRTELETKLDIFNLGADDYITKPFLFEEFLARVRAVLKRPPTAQKQILRIADLIVNVDRHSVRRGRQDIYLTRKELALLEYLLKNRGQILSRPLILEHVWDINADPFSNTIESHILNLRRKINIAGKPELIHTISGRGYKIDLKK